MLVATASSSVAVGPEGRAKRRDPYGTTERARSGLAEVSPHLPRARKRCKRFVLTSARYRAPLLAAPGGLLPTEYDCATKYMALFGPGQPDSRPLRRSLILR